MAGWRDRVLGGTAIVYDQSSGRLLGSAVLIDDGHLLTCRHVVSHGGKAFGPLLERMLLDFPDVKRVQAVPMEGPPGVDAVLLHIEGSPRDMPRPVEVSGARRQPKSVELLGYPALDNTLDGVWRAFEVDGISATGLVQLAAITGPSLPGHSGGPVVDARTGCLVGLFREGSERLRFDRYVPLTLLQKKGLIQLPWQVKVEDAYSRFTRSSTGRRLGA